MWLYSSLLLYIYILLYYLLTEHEDTVELQVFWRVCAFVRAGARVCMCVFARAWCIILCVFRMPLIRYESDEFVKISLYQNAAQWFESL